MGVLKKGEAQAYYAENPDQVPEREELLRVELIDEFDPDVTEDARLFYWLLLQLLADDYEWKGSKKSREPHQEDEPADPLSRKCQCHQYCWPMHSVSHPMSTRRSKMTSMQLFAKPSARGPLGKRLKRASFCSRNWRAK